METYRFFCIDRAGVIRHSSWIEAADDEQAVQKTREVVSSGATCELWLRNRLVTRFAVQPAG